MTFTVLLSWSKIVYFRSLQLSNCGAKIYYGKIIFYSMDEDNLHQSTYNIGAKDNTIYVLLCTNTAS